MDWKDLKKGGAILYSRKSDNQLYYGIIEENQTISGIQLQRNNVLAIIMLSF